MLVFLTWSRISCHALSYTILRLQIIASLLFYESREQLSHGLICMYAHFDNLIHVLYSNIFRHRSKQRPMFCWHRQPSCLYHHIHNQHRPNPSAAFHLQPSCRSCLPLTLCHYSQHSTTRLFVFSFCFTSWSPWTEGNFYAVEEILAEKQVKRVS